MLRLFVHSVPRVKSLVRELYGKATSTSLLNPKLAPHGSSPLCFVVVNAAFTSRCGVGVASTFTLPMSRRSVRSNCGAIGTYADSVACPF